MKNLCYFTMFLFILAPSTTTLLHAQTVLNTVTSNIDAAQSSGETIKNANADLQTTLSDSKETVNEIGKTFKMLFGKKKNKDGTAADQIDIIVPNVAYGDADLKVLVESLQNQKRIKETSKKFSDGIVTISLQTKDRPDKIWESIDVTIRQPFALMEMDDSRILINKKEQEVITLVDQN